MLLTTTSTIEGMTIRRYHGLVTGEEMVGIDLFQGFHPSLGLPSASKEALQKARESAMKEMGEESRAKGGNAVLGIDLDYKVVAESGSMLMVSVSGTAVSVE